MAANRYFNRQGENMFQSFRLIYRKAKDRAAEKKRRLNLDAEGHAIIDVGIRDADSLYQPYHNARNREVDSAFGEYLRSQVMETGLRAPVSIHLHAENGDGRIDEEEVSSALKNYVDREVIDLTKRYRRNTLLICLLGIIGILLLLGMALMQSFLPELPVLYETIDIAAWVFLWEAVDKGVFERFQLRLELRLNDILSSAKIERTGKGYKSDSA